MSVLELPRVCLFDAMAGVGELSPVAPSQRRTARSRRRHIGGRVCWSGTAPGSRSGLHKAATLWLVGDDTSGGVPWVAHHAPWTRDGAVVAVKLRASGYAPAKANYWFMWRKVDGAFITQGGSVDQLFHHRAPLARRFAVGIAAVYGISEAIAIEGWVATAKIVAERNVFL